MMTKRILSNLPSGIALNSATAWSSVWRIAVPGAAVAVITLSTSVCPAWTSPRPVDLNTTTTKRFDTAVSAASGGGAKWGVAWASVSTTGTEFGVLVSRTPDEGQTWSVPVDVSATAGLPDGDHGDQPCLSTDGADTWIVTWDSSPVTANSISSDRDIFFARSADGGATWAPPQTLNLDHADSTICNSGAVLATDRASNWGAVWESEQEVPGDTYSSIRFARSADGGQSWGAPQILDLQSSIAMNAKPCLATDANGVWVAAWESTGTTDTDVLFARSTDQGASWSSATPLNSNAGADDTRWDYYDGQVRLAANGSGTWIAVWTSRYSEQTTSPVSDRIAFSRSTDNGASWSAARPVDEGVTETSFLQQDPDVVWNGEHFTVIWSSPDGLRSSTSPDLGASWSPPATVASRTYAGSSNSRPRLTASGSRSRFVAWVSHAAGSPGPDIISAVYAFPNSAGDWSLFE